MGFLYNFGKFWIKKYFKKKSGFEIIDGIRN
jgi:hypothetical protein